MHVQGGYFIRYVDTFTKMVRAIILFLSLFALCSCGRKRDAIEVSEAVIISTTRPSGGAFFTKDHHGNPVLCWTEGEKSVAMMYYALYDQSTQRFSAPLGIAPSVRSSLSPESMNKIAFKKDGTIIAAYSRKHPTDSNKYAGSIFYTQSFDHGQSWTDERRIHTDTSRSVSRSYFDIATLPDGEVGAVWLDGRMQLGEQGTSLFFSKTEGTKGFISDKQIGETVCECCRTDIFTDSHGNAHVIYRDIEQSIQGQVRDFVHIVSTDNGETFSSSLKVSADNWIINGCPHTGATMTENNHKLAVVWYTAGGLPGLYYTTMVDNNQTFKPRQLVDEHGRHPQIVSWGQKIIGVWVESKQHHGSSDHHSGKSQDTSGGILFAILDDEGKKEVVKIPATVESEFPVACSVNSNTALIAYTRKGKVNAHVLTLVP